MEIVDKEKWNEYKRGRRIEFLFTAPLIAPFILLGQGYWHLALFIVALAVYFSTKEKTFLLAQEIINRFKFKYFALVGLMFVSGVLNMLYPGSDDLVLVLLISIAVSFGGCYFAIIRKVKTHILGQANDI